MHRGTRMLVVGLIAAGVVVPAEATHQKVSRSYTVEANPLPVAAVWTVDSCAAAAQEGVHKVTRAFRAPYPGWLRATLSFDQDWDLYLTDPLGRRIATSEYQFNWGSPREVVNLYLTARREVRIVSCNVAGGLSARLEYTFTHVANPWQPVPKTLRSRVVSREYVGSAVATKDNWVICYTGYSLGCVGFTPRPTDRSVSVRITDDTADNVYAAVSQYDGDADLGESTFCTATRTRIALKPGVDWVSVSLLPGPCEDGTPAAVTTGVARFTLYNKP